MDRITMKELDEAFFQKRSDWCVSLFMPTHRAGRGSEQDPIRLKNLLREVEERLTAKGLRPAQAREMIRDPQRLLQDKLFWQRQGDGLAVFFTADAFYRFRLPCAFEELVVISRRFHVKPLLALLTGDTRFHVLALSQNEVRLLEGTQHTVDEVELEGVPRSLEEAFPDVFLDKQLQFHTGTPSGGGKRAAMFHGQDISNETKDRMVRWFRTIDKKLQTTISDSRFPLVLAGVDSLFPLYREANTHACLMDEGISGNPEGSKPEDLHGRAWAIVEPFFRKARQDADARYRQVAGTGQTTTDVKEAVAAAHHGRVEVLFVAAGLQVWGRYDAESNDLRVHDPAEPGDEDLLDLAAIRSLSTGAAVHVVPPQEVPDQALLAAIFRY